MRMKRARGRRSTSAGLGQMVAACVLFSIMNASVFAISLYEAQLPAAVISGVRIVCNVLILVLPALLGGTLRGLVGDGRPSLWLRGLFGGSALMLSFLAITRIGPGESALLTATSGVFVALLSPWVLGQRNALWGWLAIIGAFVGVALLLHPVGSGEDWLGRLMALVSGFLSALAYLMVARAGRSNAPNCVIFYFCLVALLVHGVYFWVMGWRLPEQVSTWGLLLLTGASGSAAQYCMTRAYQTAPAAMVSAVGYLAPVLSVLWGVVLFQQVPGPQAITGASLIVVFGVLLPFLTPRKTVLA
jgi:drug/metabolite transporter (DMT)-like permease